MISSHLFRCIGEFDFFHAFVPLQFDIDYFPDTNHMTTLLAVKMMLSKSKNLRPRSKIPFQPLFIRFHDGFLLSFS